MFAQTQSVGAHDAKRVGLIDHEKSTVPFFYLDELGKIWKVPVHAVEAFDDHADTFVFVPAALEQIVQALPVIVREG